MNRTAWGSFVEALVFYEPFGTVADVAALPTAKLYDHINVGMFRGPWQASAAGQTYFSFKGGENDWNHNHLDLGSFVYDLGQVRIAEDMGGDSYSLPGYFGHQRWDYYRLNSHGHNLMLFDNQSQAQKSQAEVVAFNGKAQRVGLLTVDGWAVVNLTETYRSTAGVTSYLRGFVSLSESNAVLIVDDLVYAAGARPSNATWQLHTQAQVSLDTEGKNATLTRDNITAALALLLPSSTCPGLSGLTVQALSDVLPDPPFNSAKGYRRIDGVIGDPAHACSLMAWGLGRPSDLEAFAEGSMLLNPLARWQTAGPVVAATERS